MKFDHGRRYGERIIRRQKQRVILARALYRKPLILLTDEATSHLDAETELNIVTRLSQLNITRLTIAHRQETLRSAQRILVLQNGTISAAPSTK